MEETNKNRAEEIDLFTFLKPLWDVIVSLFRAIGSFIGLIRANIVYVLLITVAAGVVGFSLRFVLPKAYRSEAVIVTHELPAKLCVILLDNLEELVKNKKNKSVVAKQLGLTDEQAASVVAIRSQLTKDSFFVNDRDTIRNFFTITAVYADSGVTSVLQKGIIDYLENNNYALKRREAKRKSLLSLKANLDVKLKSLDSLKMIVNNSIIPRSQGQGIILGEPVDPVKVYEAEINYFKEQLYLDESLATLDNVEVIQPFITTSKPNHPRFNEILLYFLGGGFLLSLVGMFFRKKA
jgi:uncharacterized protein involved in exopolysaccharide biosynthesis